MIQSSVSSFALNVALPHEVRSLTKINTETINMPTGRLVRDDKGYTIAERADVTVSEARAKRYRSEEGKQKDRIVARERMQRTREAKRNAILAAATDNLADCGYDPATAIRRAVLATFEPVERRVLQNPAAIVKDVHGDRIPMVSDNAKHPHMTFRFAEIEALAKKGHTFELAKPELRVYKTETVSAPSKSEVENIVRDLTAKFRGFSKPQGNKGQRGASKFEKFLGELDYYLTWRAMPTSGGKGNPFKSVCGYFEYTRTKDKRVEVVKRALRHGLPVTSGKRMPINCVSPKTFAEQANKYVVQRVAFEGATKTIINLAQKHVAGSSALPTPLERTVYPSIERELMFCQPGMFRKAGHIKPPSDTPACAAIPSSVKQLVSDSVVRESRKADSAFQSTWTRI